jgi:twitching motility protein PilT
MAEQPAQYLVPLQQLLKTMVEYGGTDLHITVDSAPQVRIDGRMVPLKLPPLDAAQTRWLCYGIMTDQQKHRLEEDLEVDFSFGLQGVSRFRANVFNQRGATAGAFRSIPEVIRSFDQLGLPPIVQTLCEKPRGLVLVTGVTGSGKTTSLAAMIDRINETESLHILTVEDPVEYVHRHKRSLVNQREIHADTQSFKKALRSALRQDPDVVLVGELRDLETIESALTIAETGHLTFATLHTNSCVQTINRIIDVFPSAAPDPGPAVPGAGRGALPVADPQGLGQGPGAGAGGDGAQRRHPQPHPGRQDPPNLRHHADGPDQVRHADLQPEPFRARAEERNHPGRGPLLLLQPR